jgi:hypothetical protein
MKDIKKEAVADRRSFLKLASASAAAAGSAAVLSGEAKAETGEAKQKVSLYRETEHIRRYYELAR